MPKLRKKTEAEIIELLKTGNFTVLYHDNGSGSIYAGKFENYSDLPEDTEPFADFGEWTNGYMPDLVDLMVQALGGKADSI